MNSTQSIHALQDNIARVIKGKPHVIEMAVVCLLARGHLLIEDVFVFSGDDSICLKGMPFRFPYGPAPTYGVPQPAVPVHDITVRNAVLLSTWNAMQFGPEDASDIYNVSFENIDVLEAYSGISVSAVTSLQFITQSTAAR